MGKAVILPALLVVLGTVFSPVATEPIEDKQALLDFLQNSFHSMPLNWNLSSPACGNWSGVTCNHDQTRIISLRLPPYRFQGPVPENTIGRLSSLQVLGMNSNSFSGGFPTDFLNLTNLISLYLQSNYFSGPLPVNISAWKNLAVLDLSNNHFGQTIPMSLSNLSRLTVLNLSSNAFSGEIPDFNLLGLLLLDLSRNNLNGTLPLSLRRFPASAFLGNNVSFGVSNPPVPSPTAQPTERSSKISESAMLGIVIGSCITLFVLITLILLFRHSKQNGYDRASKDSYLRDGWSEKSESQRVSRSKKGRCGNVVFFEGRNLAFDLEDLLRASAEVLGKGSFGTSYKAALEDSGTVVVKRLREVSVARRDFEHQMELIGAVRHENVAPLRAYYYSKDEKLMVHDYYRSGSASALLHANRGEDRTALDWETRLRIAVGAARGIAHIHSCKLVHGNIKSSNIFLGPKQYGCVSDLGLATLTVTAISRSGGYRAPEITDSRKVNHASDVYAYGVFLLELLTGKSPVHAVSGAGEEVIHLVRWVNSVVREEWTGEVFDVELLRYENIEEEMVEMLQIGLQCVARVPDQRPRMAEVVKSVEDIWRADKNFSEASTATAMAAAEEQGASPVVVH